MPNARPVAAIFFVLIVAGAAAASLTFVETDVTGDAATVMTVLEQTSSLWLYLVGFIMLFAGVIFAAKALQQTGRSSRGRFR